MYSPVPLLLNPAKCAGFKFMLWTIVGALFIFFIIIPILIGILCAMPKWFWIVVIFLVGTSMMLIGTTLESKPTQVPLTPCQEYNNAFGGGGC